jgi:hypothetical protein
MGPIRVAQPLPIVVTPHRFRTRSQFWACCGLGIVMRSSSDWVRTEGGGWMRANVQQTRALNRNHVPRLKDIFKGAATTVVTKLPDDPLRAHYQGLLAAGTKPNLAKLTIAGRVAALVLGTWKDGKEHDPATLRAKQQEDVASPVSLSAVVTAPTSGSRTEGATRSEVSIRVLPGPVTPRRSPHGQELPLHGTE